MYNLEDALRKIIDIDYGDTYFDNVRNVITDDYELMPAPFICNIEEAALATATINSHSKEFIEGSPIILRKNNDDYINLINNFDE